MSADIVYPERFHGINARRISGADAVLATPLATPASNVVALPAKADGPNYPRVPAGCQPDEGQHCHEDNIRVLDEVLKLVEEGQALGIVTGVMMMDENNAPTFTTYISRGCYREHFATIAMIESIRHRSMESFMADTMGPEFEYET